MSIPFTACIYDYIPNIQIEQIGIKFLRICSACLLMFLRLINLFVIWFYSHQLSKSWQIISYRESYGNLVNWYGVINGILANSTWWFHQMETFSALLAFYVGNSPVTGTKANDMELSCFFNPRLNKWLSKQSWGCWFQMPSGSLWHHCNVNHSAEFMQGNCWSPMGILLTKDQ